MVHGIYDKESCPNLQFSRYGATRGHDLKLFKKDCATTIRLNFFSNRIVNKWNCLSSNVVHATSVNSFKNKLEEYFGKTKDWEPWLVVARSVSGCTRHPGQVQDARYVCVGKTESGTV